MTASLVLPLVRPIVLRSSWSEGVHVFYFFKEEVKTFDIACAMEMALREAGITPKSGKVELFPNTKSHGAFYKAHRLPLQPQTGAMILDENYEPITDSVEKFLDMADRTAEFQDMELIKESCKKYGKLLRLNRCARGKGSLKKFENDLLDEFCEGFTAAGQTNNLLLTIACYGVVFMGLDEEVGINPLADYIVETITSLDGYDQYCNHQHEIEKRARDVAKSSQSFYWAVGKNRKRHGTFLDNYGKILNGVANKNQEKAAKTLQRLQDLLDHLKESGEEIPTTMKAFKLLLIEKSKAIFGEGFSPVTLGKPNYKSKWLPVFTVLAAAQVAMAQPVEATTPIVTSEPKQVELITGVTQEGVKSAVKTTPKMAQTRTKQQGYTPCKKVSEVKPPEPPENKEGTHLALYGGFGKGAAPTSENSKNLSPVPRPSQSSSPASHEQPATNLQKPRPVLNSEQNQRLSLEREKREQAYLRQMEQLHSHQNALDAQRTTPEYKTISEQSFSAIKLILARARAKFKRGNPSSPT